MDHLTEDAQALLRAAREIHAERHGSQTFTLGTHLPLQAAGQRTSINPERLRYYDAIKELEYEGAIEWAYPRGARVKLRLRFRSQKHYARVKAEFHNPSGEVIRLEGTSHPREESGTAHTEVLLTGGVPESAALGTYECTSV